VDRVICVRSNPDPERLFVYAIATNLEEVRAGAKSAYYPVELSQAIHTVLRESKRYAVIGLPCTLKALRLAMLADRRLRDRISVTAGLVCGQTKSRAFVEYLTRSQVIDPDRVRAFSFREKDASRSASNFFARVTSPEKMACLPWTGLYGRTWMGGEFTPRPCRFCDDVFAEVADIAFMDAWLPEYVKDGRGTSIILSRSKLAEQIIEGGIARAEISLQSIAVDKVIVSQAGVVEQKRKLLAYRLWMAGKKSAPLRKRVSPVRPPWFQRPELIARENLRATSHEAVSAAGSVGKDWMQTYDSVMRMDRRRLDIILHLAHYYDRVRTAV
jgi:coenzyme F420-reducing hydrogenase beta subunit